MLNDNSVSELEKKHLKYNITIIVVGILMICLSGLLADYSRYPKYKRYPLRLKMVQINYTSFWNYLTGQREVTVYHYDRHKPTHPDPNKQIIYDNPNE